MQQPMCHPDFLHEASNRFACAAFSEESRMKFADDNKLDRKSGGVAAIILAAGKSTRMGEAKQLLRLGESTVLGQIVENVRCSAVDEIVLVLGSSAEAIRRQLPPSLLEGVKVVINPAYEQGMASSLQAGLSALDPQIEAALIVLADQPFVRPETLNQLGHEHRRSKAQIVIPSYHGLRGNPVLLDRSVFAEVMALEGDIGCRAIFGSHTERTVKIEVEDEGILLDIDNHEDYERLREASPPHTGE
jgi:molybdenum cofactor cytidylyltransferase